MFITAYDGGFAFRGRLCSGSYKREGKEYTSALRSTSPTSFTTYTKIYHQYLGPIYMKRG